jgi:hypothetical protein
MAKRTVLIPEFLYFAPTQRVPLEQARLRGKAAYDILENPTRLRLDNHAGVIGLYDTMLTLLVQYTISSSGGVGLPHAKDLEVNLAGALLPTFVSADVWAAFPREEFAGLVERALGQPYTMPFIERHPSLHAHHSSLPESFMLSDDMPFQVRIAPQTNAAEMMFDAATQTGYLCVDQRLPEYLRHVALFSAWLKAAFDKLYSADVTADMPTREGLQRLAFGLFTRIALSGLWCWDAIQQEAFQTFINESAERVMTELYQQHGNRVLEQTMRQMVGDHFHDDKLPMN